jgi:hypothetical protein
METTTNATPAKKPATAMDRYIEIRRDFEAHRKECSICFENPVFCWGCEEGSELRDTVDHYALEAGF